MTRHPASPEDRDAMRRKFKKDIAGGGLGLALLAAIARAEGPVHGYQLTRELESLAPNQALPVRAGAIYPALRSLERFGLLSSETHPSVAGPPRRCYRATELGRVVLPDWIAIWRTQAAFIEAALAGEAVPAASQVSPAKRTTRTKERIDA